MTPADLAVATHWPLREWEKAERALGSHRDLLWNTLLGICGVDIHRPPSMAAVSLVAALETPAAGPWGSGSSAGTNAPTDDGAGGG